MTVPRISVLMGIYNCAETLPEAIESILNQTVQDFELILCDDGSVDDTYALAESYRERYPEKIVLLKNEKNMGLIATLNRCLAAARGELIARMDGDDRCDPDRFEKELAALKANPDRAFVGTVIRLFDEDGVWGNTRPVPFPEKKDFAWGNPFSHGSCMAHKWAYDAVGGYTEDERVVRVEDFHLWMKMYEIGLRGMNLMEPLYDLRDDLKATARRRLKARLNEAYVTWVSIWRLGIPKWKLVLCLRPIILGLLPRKTYLALHKKKLGTAQKEYKGEH